MAGKSKKKASVKLSLADRPEPLQRDDVKCPICWSILMEPVSLPCTHKLCFECFKKHVEETSLQCPCCRMRLSVWSRKAFRDNNLVDKKLWNRIQKEFPKLVQTRICGQDSQDLLPEDFMSVYDKQGNELNDADDELESSSRNVRRDGEICTTNGTIRLELEGLMQKHLEDIENERLAEERESAELIKQLQNEVPSPPKVDPSVVENDFVLAQKIAEQEKAAISEAINARRKLFTELPEFSQKVKSVTGSNYSNSSQKLKVVTTNKSKSKNGSSWSNTPKSSVKRPSLSTLNSHSAKKLKDGKHINHRTGLITSSQGSCSQISLSSPGSLLTYFTSSQGEGRSILKTNSCSPPGPKPCTSTSAEAEKEFPVLSSGSMFTLSPDILSSLSSPERLRKPSLLKPPNDSLNVCGIEETAVYERNSSNSIDLEVIEVNHFSPFRSASQTSNLSPPTRISGGLELPATPSSVKTTPGKDGQGASADSGSASTLNVIESSEVSRDNPNFTSQSLQKSSLIVNIQPDTAVPEEQEDLPEGWASNPDPPCISIYDSPSSASDLQRQLLAHTPIPSDDEADIAWLIEEGQKSPSLSQDSRIDLEQINRQAEAFEKIRQKFLQEAVDRQLAKKLQKEMNSPQPRSDNPYSIRSWLNRSGRSK